VEIQIQKESAVCIGCDSAFAHGQKHHSLLRIQEGAFLREDYCDTCWTEKSFSIERDEIYSCWETKYRDPSVEKATPKEQFIPLLNLCYESIAQGGQDAESMAYMCALVLRRQRVFKFIREEKEDSSGKTVLVFSDKHNDTQIRIVDPQLTQSQLEDVRLKLEELVEHARGHTDDR